MEEDCERDETEEALDDLHCWDSYEVLLQRETFGDDKYGRKENVLKWESTLSYLGRQRQYDFKLGG